MNSLLLTGFGIKLSVEHGHLHVRNGISSDVAEPEKFVLKPKRLDYDNILIYGHTGSVSLEALKWLSRMNLPLTILDWDGKNLSNILTPEAIRSQVRMAQYKAFEERRVEIARLLIEAKVKGNMRVLTWLSERYPHLREEQADAFRQIEEFVPQLKSAKNTQRVMILEGNIAQFYWTIVGACINGKLEFEGRNVGKTFRPMGATDPVNALFNYAYGMVEAQSWKALNANGFDPQFGFLHEMAPGKAPLVYDFQEPFRWVADYVVIKALENKLFTKSDFLQTTNYNIRLRPLGARKLTLSLNDALTTRVLYKEKNWQYGYVIAQKAGELGDYLQGKTKTLDLSEPFFELRRDDSAEMREKILAMPYAEWKKMGFSKGSLHYLKANAKDDKPFKVYGKVKEKFEGAQTP